MHHSIRVFSVIRTCFVKTDQQQVIEISGTLLKFWNDGNVPNSVSWELVSQHNLACSILVVFFCHNVPPICKILLHIALQIRKVAQDWTTYSEI